MRKFLRRKTSPTSLDVLSPAVTDLHADFGHDDTPSLTADEAYDTLPRDVVRSVPAGDIIARVRAEYADRQVA